MVASTIEARVAITVSSKFEAIVAIYDASTGALMVTSTFVATVGVKVISIGA
jgi:hypothetical protein